MYATSGRNISDSAQVNPGVIGTTDLADNAVTDAKIGAHTTSKITVPTANLSGTLASGLFAAASIAYTKIAAATQGYLLYFGAAGAASLLAPGTAGQFLKTNGAGADPSWGDPVSSYSTGTTIFIRNDTEIGQATTSPTKTREFALPKGGTINVYFEIKQNGGGGSHAARIYVNGVAVGTNRTGSGQTYVAYNEDITVQQDDLVQIYCTAPTGGLSCMLQNVRLRAAHYDVPLNLL